ncbi:dNTP triphosphohydrolase [Paenibacillus sp. 19GGS1-52]|uniref:dGTP triphosphohydrolase n=1 Tax=Paenibacillus sp. 19GGS1-52 TaxID=2758563 RepID=UPI001EFBFAFE|nr:dNTP triphosphohydrolase [Paenibacillus sp. 19GGS1-52]ULO07039.1 dNTP triphosphohydrolase [Paenibacillus sp. 19GGS1-52]
MSNTKMNWNSLLSGIRLRDGKVKDRISYNEYDLRNDFDDDYSRLVSSSAVRRLQDKAQVFPLDNSDFVRTRLTHSHEVSTIGRSLGISIENRLISDNLLDIEHKGKLGSLLAVAGLMHDLGNPPYGHFGEAAIQKFFSNWFEKEGLKFRKILGEQKCADFTNFEGNAQTFRLISKLNNLFDEYGFNLSAASLASILKYPRSSIEGNKDDDTRKQNNYGVSYKKFGYLQAETERFDAVKHYTGISIHRHPVTFLLEAADDIAYAAADIEDGCKKRVLDYEIIKEKLSKHLEKGTEEEKEILSSFVASYKKNCEEKRSDRLDNAVQNLRIKAQGFMIKSVVKEFLSRHNEILDGDFDQDIIMASEARNVRKAMKDISYVIFDNKEIVLREYAGGKVIHGLLEMFVACVVSEKRNDPKTEEGKLYLLISGNYKDIMNKYCFERDGDHPSVYDRLLLVTDFVCGMTDSYALDFYRRLTGITL